MKIYKFWSKYPNYSFWDEIRHTRGQIKRWFRSMCQDICLKSITCCPVISLAKAQLTWTSPCCSIPQQREPWCCCHWSGLSTLITLRSQIRASSWTFSPTSIFQRSPPQLAVTFLHFCLKPEITFDTMASLHEHMHRVFCIVVTLRGDWEDLKLCSYEVTNLHLKYI